MPRNKEYLLEQIARAKRFAAALNTAADRERFEKMADLVIGKNCRVPET
jgi:hypothetical protein